MRGRGWVQWKIKKLYYLCYCRVWEFLDIWRITRKLTEVGNVERGFDDTRSDLDTLFSSCCSLLSSFHCHWSEVCELFVGVCEGAHHYGNWLTISHSNVSLSLPFFFRSRGSPRGPPYLGEEEAKSCCGLLVTQAVSIRWFIIMIAFVGLCCTVVGTVLGAVKTYNSEYVTITLLMIGEYYHIHCCCCCCCPLIQLIFRFSVCLSVWNVRETCVEGHNTLKGIGAFSPD